MDQSLLELIELDEQIRKLNDKKTELLKAYYEKNGDKETVAHQPENEKPWTRAKVVDNLKELEEKGTVFRASAFPRFSLKVDHLKNEPKK